MSRGKRVLVALGVVGATFVPAAGALAAVNHSESLLADD